MGLRLFFLPNFPGAMLIQGGTFIPDSRVRTTFQMRRKNKSGIFSRICRFLDHIFPIIKLSNSGIHNFLSQMDQIKDAKRCFH